jgi:hypothetical protein
MMVAGTNRIVEYDMSDEYFIYGIDLLRLDTHQSDK